VQEGKGCVYGQYSATQLQKLGLLLFCGAGLHRMCGVVSGKVHRLIRKYTAPVGIALVVAEELRCRTRLESAGRRRAAYIAQADAVVPERK
jgi:hypothetical protein